MEIIKTTRNLTSAIVLFCLMSSSNAAFITGLSIGYGSGFRDEIQGGRVSLIHDWNHTWFATWPLNLRAYLDFSVVFWNTTGDKMGRHKNIMTFAAAPVFVVQFNRKYIKLFDPYFQISIGPAIVTNTRIGNYDLGGILLFQDLIGVGLRFGPKQRFDVSLNFLHYSNADIIPPNNGITIKKYLSLTYHFV